MEGAKNKNSLRKIICKMIFLSEKVENFKKVKIILEKRLTLPRAAVIIRSIGKVIPHCQRKLTMLESNEV